MTHLDYLRSGTGDTAMLVKLLSASPKGSFAGLVRTNAGLCHFGECDWLIIMLLFVKVHINRKRVTYTSPSW